MERIAIVLSLAVLTACDRPPAPPAGPPDLVNVTPDFNLMASDFVRDFDEAKYRGKVIEVTGIYFTWTLVGEPRRATDITLMAHTFDNKLFFALDREVMDKRFLILDYWSLIRMKGRFERHDPDGTFRFRDSVLTTTRVVASEYPTAIKATAEELTEAWWPPGKDVAEARKYGGRVIEVSGTVASVDGHDVVLKSVSESRPVRCHLQDPDPSISPGQTVTLKGFCWGHVAGTTGITVDGCIRP